jgi:hypothetical protein
MIIGLSIVHALWSVFFAAYIYHKVTESLTGLAFGLSISLISFNIDDLSDMLNSTKNRV